MIVSPKLCIKCGVEIYKNGKVALNYRQWKLLREPVKKGEKPILFVATCNKCEIVKGDLDGIQKAFAKHWGKFDEKLIGVDSYQDLSELKKLSQDGKCIVCMEDLGENYIHTNGMYFHENCTISKKERKLT